MNPPELTGAVTAIANALACKLTPEEITLLAAVFVQLGDTLATIATVQNNKVAFVKEQAMTPRHDINT